MDILWEIGALIFLVLFFVWAWIEQLPDPKEKK